MTSEALDITNSSYSPEWSQELDMPLENSETTREIRLHGVDGKPFRELVELPDGETLYRDTLYAEHEGKQIEKAYLYHPDPQFIGLESPVAIQNQGGYMTVGDDYARVAVRMALGGYMYVTHKPLRAISVRDQLFHEEHSKDPFLYTALVGQKVMNATLMHLIKELDIDTNAVDLSCHSYGGPVGTLLARLSPEVRYVILQDVAGVIDNSLAAHVKGLPGMAGDGVDAGKAVANSDKVLTPDLARQHLHHVASNPLLATREGYALVRNPDISDNVNFARDEYGTRFAGIMLEQSAFFPHEQADACAKRKKLFDAVMRINARHCEPNVNPKNADAQIGMIRQLDSQYGLAA